MGVGVGASKGYNIPLSSYQLSIEVITPNTNGLSSIPMRNLSAKTSLVVLIAEKQKVTIVQKNSTMESS